MEEYNEETSPNIQLLLNRVYPQTIDLSELLNILQWFDFPGLLCWDTWLLLLLVLLYYCTNIFDILTKHALIQLKFISLVRHSVLIKILEFEDKSVFFIEDMNLFDILIDYSETTCALAQKCKYWFMWYFQQTFIS
jgi:hypothetical protein